MNTQRFVSCFLFVVAFIGLAEGWLIAAGVVELPATDFLALSGSDRPKCNMTDISNPTCPQDPNNPPGKSCSTTYPVFSKEKGETLDVYENPTETMDRCTSDYCAKKTVQKSLSSPDCDSVPVEADP